jgi:hypothetical protein
MRKLTGTDTILKWAQPAPNNRFFKLRSGDDVIATLSWEKIFGTLATAQTAERTWTFKRVGFFNARVTVRSPGSDADIAVFKPSWGYGGTLEVQGRAYMWKKLDFWGNRWGFAWNDGTVLLSFGYAGGLESFLKIEGNVELSPGNVSTNPDMPLLATLGWYIMVLMWDDNAAAAGAVAATM